MSLFTVTINNLSPALDHKFQEVAQIARYLQVAGQAVQSAQGQQTSGNIVDNGGNVFGSWTYTPQASN
jgi:hypothetical protein